MTVNEAIAQLSEVDGEAELSAFIHIGDKNHIVKEIGDIRTKAIAGEVILNVYCEPQDFQIVLKR